MHLLGSQYDPEGVGRMTESELADWYIRLTLTRASSFF